MDVVSFFAGCGGLDLGFEQAGFRVVWANEFEPHCCATYVRNHPDTEFVLGDVRKIDPHLIPDCDGFIGGPPCQSWSVGGKQKGLDDERGQLFLKYIELINVKKPKFFVIENVKGMLDDKFKEVFEDFVNRLDYAGYDVQWALLDAVNFGVPQNRERVIFIGFRKELDVTYMFPNPICEEHVTLQQFIGDITETPRFFSEGSHQELLNIDEERPNHDVLTSKFGSFYYRGNRRRGWHQPSFTINATADFAPLHPSSPKMLYYGHENWKFQKDKFVKYRRLSVRECARIQTFPDNFIFEYEDIKDAYKMIGNAVPPKLGEVLAKSILAALAHAQPTEGVGVITTPSTMDACTLVGYHKGEGHKKLIIENGIYYVRSDGRMGSIFKEDCTVIPKYLLLHHKDEAEFYELDGEEPILADATFLKSLGFKTSGETYLVFRIKDRASIELGLPKYDNRNYAPYFTTVGQLINEDENEIKSNG